MRTEGIAAQQWGQNTDDTVFSQQKTINYRTKPEEVGPSKEALTNPVRSLALPKKQTIPQQQSKPIDQNQKNQARRKHLDFSSE